MPVSLWPSPNEPVEWGAKMRAEAPDGDKALGFCWRGHLGLVARCMTYTASPPSGAITVRMQVK